MKLLDAVNIILPKLGEAQVTSISALHPTVSIIVQEIEQVQKALLLKGWWFNEFDYTASPDTEGHITFGDNVLQFTPTAANVAVQRGASLYNPITLSSVFTTPVEGRITENIEFDELPEAAASEITYTALVNVYVGDIGSTSDVAVWAKRADEAHGELLAQHCRQRRLGTRRSTRWVRYMNALRG